MKLKKNTPKTTVRALQTNIRKALLLIWKVKRTNQVKRSHKKRGN